MKVFNVKEKITMLSIVTAFALILVLAFNGKASAEEEQPLTGLSATEVVEQMGIGWNLGNTFDATGGNKTDVLSHEQSWGNPVVTQELIDAVKAGGFNTIRIPVTWDREIADDGAYTINPEFLARIKEVVDYAYANDMFVILNVHHESWVNDAELELNYESIGEQLMAVWLQLADYFADYDQHLIFEGMNEPRKAGTDIEWTGNQESYEAVNYLTQIFVNAVRSSDKGYNQERCLMVPGYAASSSTSIMNAISLPTVDGKTVKNLIVSVHCYSPYNFCLSDTDKNFDPTSQASVGEINSIFSSIKSLFLDNGIPVVIGETSATNKNNTEAREAWGEYMGMMSAGYGVPIVIWDNGANGSSGGECHAYINRYKNEWNFPTVVEALMKGFNETEWKSMGGSDGGNAPTSLIGGNVVWSNAEGLTSTALWDASFIQMGSMFSWYTEGRELAVVFSGAGEPKIILDSAEKGVWWIPVDPNRIEESGDKKVAYFTYDALIKAMNDNGVDSPTQLRNLSILAANDNITVYELCYIGGANVATFIANGKVVAMGTEIPEDPTYTNMEFAGWYTTKDYLEGTEFTGGELSENVTVYACFDLTIDMLAEKAELEEIRANTPEPTEAPTKAPTKAPTEGAKPDATKPAAADTPEDEGNGGAIKIILIVLVAVAVVVTAFVGIKTRHKK